MNIRNKITFMFIFLVGSLLLGVFLFIYIFSYRYTKSEFYQRLEERANIAAQSHLEKDELSTAIYDEIRKKHLQILPNEKEAIYRADISNRTVTLAKGAAPHVLPEKYFQQVFKRRYAQFEADKTHYVGILYSDNEGDFIVVVSANNYFGQTKMNNLRSLLIVAFLGGLGGVYFLGRYYAGRVLEPISDITAKANEIKASNLHLRLPEGNGKDELAKLAVTFNQMLDRLENAFEIQTNFVNNASHELRNPLTAILGEIEVALGRDRAVEEYKSSLEVIEKEAQRLALLVNSLLELAQTAPEGKGWAVEPIRIDELVMELKQALDAAHPENSIVLDFSSLPSRAESLIINGNPGLLKVALNNLLDNARKFSMDDEVVVRITAEKDRVELLVKDLGIGIPESDLNHIAEPFYRAANARGFKGFGVGLPLTQKIIRLHGAAMQISSEIMKGTEVRLSFPT